jgi:two-component system, response regulator YesN
VYSVLIVDDEEWIRKGLVSKIGRCGLPIGEIDQASNAEQALEMLRSRIPDILLCDIRMEGIDGLEMIRIVHYKYPSIKLIISSGYGEFDYAAEALKHGVTDYLLKPIDTEMLHAALSKCIRLHEEERTQLSQMHDLRRIEFAKENKRKVHRILHRDLNPDQIFPSYRDDYLFQAICLFYDKRANTLDLEQIDDTVARDPIWAFQRNLVYYQQSDHETLLIVAIPSPQRVDEYKAHVERLLGNLEMELRSEGIHRYTLGVSDHHHDLDTSIRQAIYCVKHRIFLEEKQVVRSADIVTFQGSYKLDPMCLARLRHLVDQGDLKGIATTLSKIYGEVMHASVSYRCIQNLYAKFLILTTEEFGVDIESMVFALPVEVHEFSSIRQMFEAIRALFTAIVNSSRASCTLHDAVIEAVKAYIDEHYHEDLRQEEVATLFGYNASYLSALFKEVSGTNFQVYVQTVRIEHAKRLMRNGDYKIKEIAQSIGFNDPNYFSQVFKKVEGITPTEYVSHYL